MFGVGFVETLDGLFAAGAENVLAGGVDIVGLGFALNDFQGAGRAGSDAVAKSVAELLLHDLGLAVDNL